VVAAALAARGFEVVGVDIDERTVDLVARGIAPVLEPGIEDLYAAAHGRLRATADLPAAVAETDASILVVPTPSEPDGGYSLRYVLDAAEAIGSALRRKRSRHLVVLRSTVLPGDCEGRVVPALERASGLRCGPDFGLVYNPDFIALGSVIRDLFAPGLVLIGSPSAHDAARWCEVYTRFLDVAPPVETMSCANAELAKVALNSFVTMKITFANLLAQVCQRLPGGDVDAVTGALARDARIGAPYLRGGLGYGGPCFPRDNRALAHAAARLGVDFPLAAATDEANDSIAPQVADLVSSRVPPGARVAVLGLAYKPGTPVVEASQALALARILAERGLSVVAYDPQASAEVDTALGPRVARAASAKECVAGSDAVVIATPWEEFREIVGLLPSGTSAPIVIDCFGLLGDRSSRPTHVVRLGVHSSVV
jgi:UDPglucose 6-dehydrogenase